jgi:predicted MFS family arabinose efflux permease
MVAALLPAMAEGVSSVAFLVMMREAVQEKLITPLVSRRHFGMNFALGISTLVLGLWLEHTLFPANYQIMFGLCFIFALISLYHTMQVRVQPREQPLLTPIESQPKRSVWRSPAFQSVALATMVTHIAYFALVPIAPLWLVNHFQAGEQFIALYGVAELVAAVLIASVISRLIARIGSNAMITLSMLGMALSAVILAFAPHVYLTLIASALSGAAWTAVNIALFGYFSERTPVAESPRYTTAFIQMVYLSVFIGPLLGSALADQGVDLMSVLLLGAVVRLLAGAMTQIDLPQWVRRSTAAATR